MNAIQKIEAQISKIINGTIHIEPETMALAIDMSLGEWLALPEHVQRDFCNNVLDSGITIAVSNALAKCGGEV